MRAETCLLAPVLASARMQVLVGFVPTSLRLAKLTPGMLVALMPTALMAAMESDSALPSAMVMVPTPLTVLI